MKRSVPMARSGKLKSAHWSSQDDYRFGNQSPGKWQKKETKPVQLGKQNAKAVQPTVGPLPSHNCWLKDFLLEPTFSCSFAYSFIFSVANRLRHIYEISLSTCLSSPLFFFFLLSSPLICSIESRLFPLTWPVFKGLLPLYQVNTSKTHAEDQGRKDQFSPFIS